MMTSRSATVVVRSDKIAERRRAVRAHRRRRRMRILAATLVVGALLAGGFALTRSQLFQLGEVEVVGNASIARDAILRAGGITVGSPALGIDLDAAEVRIRALPEVEDVRIERTGTLSLRVQVVPRRAALLIEDGSSRMMVDKHGVAITGPRPGRIPVLRSQGAPDAFTVRGVLTVWNAASSTMRRRIDSFEQTADGLVLSLGETRVLLGQADRVREKLMALRLVRARIKDEGVRLAWLDLRAPSRPAVRLA